MNIKALGIDSGHEFTHEPPLYMDDARSLVPPVQAIPGIERIRDGEDELNGEEFLLPWVDFSTRDSSEMKW